MLRQTILLVLLATGWAKGDKGMNSRFKPAMYNDNDMTASSIRESKASNYQNLQSLDDQVQREGGAAPISSGADYGYETDGATDSYQPTYQAQGYGEIDKLDHFLKAIAVFLPIGVFLSAIVPNIVTISTGRRKRSLETNSIGDDSFDPQVTFPILDMISKYGMKALQDPNCQAKFACEMGTMGGLPEANGIQRALWMGAQFVPDHMARSVGADKLVRSIRSRRCTDYACQ